MVIYQSKERTRRFYTFVAFLAVVGIVGGVVLSKIIFGGISAQDLQEKLVEVRRGTCQDTNARNRRTINEIDRQIKAILKKHPEKKAQLERERDSTVLLINTLVPVRDCAAFAAELK